MLITPFKNSFDSICKSDDGQLSACAKCEALKQSFFEWLWWHWEAESTERVLRSTFSGYTQKRYDLGFTELSAIKLRRISEDRMYF